MAILLERKVWKRPREPRGDRLNRLTPDEQENVLAAFRILRDRRGSWAHVARAMGVTKRQVTAYAGGHLRPSAGLAIRVAKLAGVSVDDVLSGAFARPHKCSVCGQLLPVRG